MSISLPGPLVSTRWLADHLGTDNLVLLDGSYKLPGATPTATEDYARQHIPGARFFDIDRIAASGSSLPHMLPDAAEFEAVAGKLGVGNDTLVVIYDTHGLMSAPRVWWTWRVFGHDKVAILDGGLKRWLAEGRAVTTEVPAPRPASFTARFRADLLRDKSALLTNLTTQAEQVIDARSAPRFEGTEAEVRPGLRAGHIPGSRNLPFTTLSNPVTGEVLSPDAIRAAFLSAGVDLDQPVVASCGSGVTAGVLLFGLHLIGKEDTALYDGSWAEWGIPGDTPIATGPAEHMANPPPIRAFDSPVAAK
ncbi:3-mercaptopyruvate sulfurtransferase [Rhizobium straminoryzae]|uniref:3-mercaptopyruvate sulfurtransferase n=1 Tax=Rhizobium straminoryzae TaxID=1387186 RepID=A0A549THA3_9HYPH|nr:3-mercaptopyruvate sulfurtransferase [Rhizobium straminoryzae]TRL42307.1 3-mercaptopyruvate sulfurtransferase [Rhizobium straminoryzae]